MDKADWDKIKEKLSTLFGKAELECDGYKVDLFKEYYNENRLCISVYIDGYMKGKWLTEDCEERRRFAHCKKRLLRLPKGFDTKGLTKKKLKALDEQRTYYSYGFCWFNFDEMRRHFEKNNKEIKLVGDGND